MIITPFQISTLITAFVSLFLGISIYSRERKSKLNFSWFLASLSISGWSLGLFGVVFSKTRDNAWLWQHILDFSAILIPALFLNFILVLIKKERKFLWLRIFSITISICLIFLSFTRLFKEDVSPKFGLNYWIDPGILYFLFPLIFSIFIIISVYITIKEYYQTDDKTLRQQLKYVLWAQLFGWGGGVTNFFPQLFKIYPFGNYLVILYVTFIAYAALKHHLFNIKVIATELLTFGVWIFLLVKLALSETLNDLVVNSFLLTSIVFLGTYLIRSVLKEVKQRERIEKMSEDVKKAYEIEKNAHERIKLAYDKEKKTLAKEKEVIKELERLDKAKSQFMMATQHHLRTPLTSMRGYLDLIFGGSYGKIPPKLKEVLKRFEVSARNEVKVVDEFLDISQFQLGKDVVFLREGIDIVPIIKEAIEDVKLEAMGRGIYVKMEAVKDVPKIKADEQKLKAAIYNIIDNAIKYTKKGGVAIKLKKIGENLQIAIKDTGVGISKEEKDRLFGRLFERGEQAEKMFTTGRGIGLYISFKIIEAHKGKLWVESEGKGKGSTFYIELPVSVLGKGEEK